MDPDCEASLLQNSRRLFWSRRLKNFRFIGNQSLCAGIWYGSVESLKERVRSGLVYPTQILNPFLKVQKPILRRKFPEPKRMSKRGRPRIVYFWVLAGTCIIAKLVNIPWRDLPSNLSSCTFLLEKGLLRRISSYSTFNGFWNRISIENLETWTSCRGYHLSKLDSRGLAIDSSGLETMSVSIGGLSNRTDASFPRLLSSSEKFILFHLPFQKSCSSYIYRISGARSSWI